MTSESRPLPSDAEVARAVTEAIRRTGAHILTRGQAEHLKRRARLYPMKETNKP